jgi:hypothetical protein
MDSNKLLPFYSLPKPSEPVLHHCQLLLEKLYAKTDIMLWRPSPSPIEDAIVESLICYKSYCRSTKKVTD